MVQRLESGNTAPVKRETEETLSWDKVPEDVREAYLRKERKKAKFNVTEMRDQELAEMEMAT
ncbi:MAG: hypothetical protein QNJ65_12020 [Xenococcaceae cyanobacterium MO_234.B1]|nr:hypothetical protein [Xenococcaceae cyanobacterium MO_234.B1]